MGSLFSSRKEQSEDNDFSSIRNFSNISPKSEIFVDSNNHSALHLINPITNKEIYEINQKLDSHNRISLIYLLAKDYDAAFEIMLNLKYPYYFKRFLHEVVRSNYGSYEIIEALCIIQNYEAIKTLKYEISQLEEVFSPINCHNTVYINKTRKLFYYIMTKLTKREKNELIQLFKENADIETFPQYNEYLEMYFAFLFKNNYANDNELSYFSNIFITMNLDYYVELIKQHESSKITHLKRRTSNNNNFVINEEERQATLGNQTIPELNDDVYPMNEKCPGIMLIIENIYFFDELDEKYKDQVIESETVLETRNGSNIDSEKIFKLFKRFGYTVLHYTNKTHLEMLQIIQNVAHEHITKDHSSFFLVILSHGLRNQVIGSNSVPITINEIKQKMNSKVLEGKPKVLIIQACQGVQPMILNNLNKVQSEDEDNSLEEVESSNDPFHNNIFELFATVPGYGAFRNWMIQDLCTVLETDYRKQSFSDIVTRVCCLVANRKVCLENGEIGIMVPCSHSTLHRKLFLPPLRDVTED